MTVPRRAKMWLAATFALASMTGLAGCADDDPTPAVSSAALPFERTESREPCAQLNRLRNPYFGDLHIHTAYSADAYIYGTRTDARAAYAFARGGAIAIADPQEEQTRSATIERALDFAAVTDHAEFFGEVRVCTTPSSTLFDSEMCSLLRQFELPQDQGGVTAQWLVLAGISNPPLSHAFCDTPGIDCDAAAVSVWQEIQAAAEEAYDRSSACSFTTFIGYEHTASPGGRHLHRNVIFRNHHVPEFATSYMETTRLGGEPHGLWTAIERDCLQAATGCDAVLIPHNPNLSGGRQWRDPVDAAAAARRRELEPLVEIHQQKGNSECRFDRLAGLGAGTQDELCTFEQEPRAHDFPLQGPPPIEAYPQRNLVRNVLKEGLRIEQAQGVNPFQLGFIGSSDSHNATGGNTDELVWEGGEGKNDASVELQLSAGLRSNPGGLAVAWAEENSRDAIFAAFKRRETYATSGTRPIVRFFSGDYDGLSCRSPDLIRLAYERGTPMGGERRAASASPDFLVWALKDTGTAAAPGTDLQRIQIVKGWVDEFGQTHERVFEVAGEPNNGATVEPSTCQPVGAGFSELCEIWNDPSFEPQQHAFYYARVLENPTCRWSTRVCKSAGVEPLSPQCAAQATAAGAAFANCCLGSDNDAFMEPLIQERAWTSPIWYRPDAVASR